MSLHDLLHELNHNLINIRAVLEASDKLVEDNFKKHRTLIEKQTKKVDEIQKKIDDLFSYKCKKDHGCWP